VDGVLGSHGKEELLTKVHVVQVLLQGVECEVLQEVHDVKVRELQTHAGHGQYHEEVGEHVCQVLTYEQHEDDEVQEVDGQESLGG